MIGAGFTDPNGPSGPADNAGAGTGAPEVVAAQAADRIATPIDPFAHRRGEPRLFAFLWTIYVLVAVAGSLLWLSRATIVSTSTYGPAARIMLLVVGAGATVLWPMARLSQASPRGSALSAALADVVVVLFPMQMILWPLIMLAQWPIGIVGALASLCTLWVLLVGGVIATALAGPVVRTPGDRGLGGRAIWMTVCIALVAAAPATAFVRRATVGASAEVAPWVTMLSPFTAVPALTGHGFSGPQNPVSPEQWWGVGALALPTGAAWLLAGWRQARRSGRRLEAGLD